jgi:thioredoxin-like negative regulator of GroEL
MAATCTVIPIATEGEFNDHTSNLPADCLAVIYFHAPWAEPCKQMGTILSTLASTYPATNPQRIAFLSLDAEEVSEVSETYDVTQVPLVVLQKNGQVVDSVTGTDASKVRNAVEQHAGAPAAGSASGSSLPPAQQGHRPQRTSLRRRRMVMQVSRSTHLVPQTRPLHLSSPAQRSMAQQKKSCTRDWESLSKRHQSCSS